MFKHKKTSVIVYIWYYVNRQFEKQYNAHYDMHHIVVQHIGISPICRYVNFAIFDFRIIYIHEEGENNMCVPVDYIVSSIFKAHWECPIINSIIFKIVVKYNFCPNICLKIQWFIHMMICQNYYHTNTNSDSNAVCARLPKICGSWKLISYTLP